MEQVYHHGWEAAGALGAGYVTYLLAGHLNMKRRLSSARKIAMGRQEQQRAYVESLDKHLDANTEHAIMEIETVEELARAVRAKTFTMEQVAIAYARVAQACHDKTNCLTEVCFDDGVQDAKKRDTESPQGEFDFLPLAGVPVSIKDCIEVRGLDTTTGLARLVGQPAMDDAPLVRLLRRAGATILCKTNIPQTLLSMESRNPVYGTCVHPENPDMVPGGSSGGEGALIASGGSLVGIGTDIGGSIRGPASFCGIYGLKPTSTRLSKDGVNTLMPGQPGLFATCGVMSRKAVNIAPVMRVLCGPESSELDPLTIPMKWDDAIVEFDAAIGYFEMPDVDAPLDLAQLLLGRGQVRLAQNQPNLAVGSLDRAVRLAPKDCGDVMLAAKTRVALAEALAQLGVRAEDQRMFTREAADLLEGDLRGTGMLPPASDSSDAGSTVEPLQDNRKQR